ncbi:hypothetical protein KUTeg_016183, partial [Tegillarca granosa]
MDIGDICGYQNCYKIQICGNQQNIVNVIKFFYTYIGMVIRYRRNLQIIIMGVLIFAILRNSSGVFWQNVYNTTDTCRLEKITFL